ncbi:MULTISPECIES: hypothetical protein [Nocardia]|uniref:hypothetical protein n=1 Tax=Nocardia TaxID=1817 RepID=UPI000D690083|nr:MULTISPECIES: hypothetical protein [Nocardia]
MIFENASRFDANERGLIAESSTHITHYDIGDPVFHPDSYAVGGPVLGAGVMIIPVRGSRSYAKSAANATPPETPA